MTNKTRGKDWAKNAMALASETTAILDGAHSDEKPDLAPTTVAKSKGDGERNESTSRETSPARPLEKEPTGKSEPRAHMMTGFRKRRDVIPGAQTTPGSPRSASAPPRRRTDLNCTSGSENISMTNVSTFANTALSKLENVTPASTTNPTTVTSVEVSPKANDNEQVNCQKTLHQKRKKLLPPTIKLDEYGFIINLDSNGIVQENVRFALPGGASTHTIETHERHLAAKKAADDAAVSSTRVTDHQSLALKEWAYQLLTKEVERSQLKAIKTSHKREKKWIAMLHEGDITKEKRKKKVRSRVRKGVPNSIRGKAWAALGRTEQKIKVDAKGVYADLVRRSSGIEEEAYALGLGGGFVSGGFDDYGNHIIGVGGGDPVMRDTIERDINRTFPRHHLFFDSDSSSCLEDGSDNDCDDDSKSSGISDSDDSAKGAVDAASAWTAGGDEGGGDKTGTVSGTSHDDAQARANNLSLNAASHRFATVLDSIQNPCAHAPSLEGALNFCVGGGGSEMKKDKVKDLSVAKGGQASLRRVLRAYSIYDTDVGYCQGMNFIAAMFITYMLEEEAFWLLVAVMNEPPCKMRNLFGEGMSEAHEVLYIAEHLIEQFLPKLKAHLDKEGVHITMFATQWLLTLFTSSFSFDLVTRVWDVFLAEGWKIVYRVMLALLDQASPELMMMRFEEILGYFKELPMKVDGATILEAALKIPLRTRHIEHYKKEYAAKQQQ